MVIISWLYHGCMVVVWWLYGSCNVVESILLSMVVELQ